MRVGRWILCFILIGTTGVCAQEAERKGTPPTLENVAYGPYERNVLDFWRAESDVPAPVLIFIHGGGFASGNKRRVRGNAVVETCLEKAFHLRRLITGLKILRPYRIFCAMRRVRCSLSDTMPRRGMSIPNASLLMVALPVRGLRFGWLFTMIWPIPIVKIPCFDNLRALWRRDFSMVSFPMIFYNGSLCSVCLLRIFIPRNVSFYGLATFDEAETEKGKQIRADVDMRGLITKDDPPVFLFCSQRGGVPQNRGHYVHHPKHAIAIKERCDEAGVEVEMYLPKMGSPPPGNVNQAMLAFFFKHLNVGAGLKPAQN